MSFPDEFLDVIRTDHFKPSIEDIIGLSEQKSELENHFADLYSLPKCILLYGAPGTGKTCLIQSLCGQKHLRPLFLNASNLTSQGPRLLQCLFNFAELNQPSVVVIDDLETLFINYERFSIEISEISAALEKIISRRQSKILFIGITNRPWIISDRLKKCFQIGIESGLLDHEERKGFIQRNLQEIKIGEEDLNRIATETSQFSGSDLKVLARDLSMVGVRKFLGVTHFKKVEIPTHSHSKYKASSESDPDSVKLDLDKIDPDSVFIEPPNTSDIVEILAKHKPSLNELDMEKFVIFTKKNFLTK